MSTALQPPGNDPAPTQPDVPRVQRPLVILVHGIRTGGRWMRRIKPILEQQGDCIIEPAGYGFFDVVRFLLPGPTRQKVVATLTWKFLHAVDLHPGRPLVIIAHSFGTYCTTEILRKTPTLRPARLLFCGSIVAQDFRWDSLSQMNAPQGLIVINECGARDVWPPLAHAVTWGYGASGTGGFQTPGVVDRWHDVGHSGYFTLDFVRKFWVPFIQRNVVAHSSFEEKMPEPSWWISLLGIRPLIPWLGWLGIGLVAGLVFALWPRTTADPATGPIISIERPIPAPQTTKEPPPDSVREVSPLPRLDYQPFEIAMYEVRVDLRLWQPFAPSEAKMKTSPVVTTRRIAGIKKEPIDHIRLYAATEGAGIDINCTSGQRFWVEHAAATGRPRVNLMEEYHLVVDISSVPVGSRFEVIATMTTWNGINPQDPWHAFVAFAEIAQMQIQLLFPPGRPYLTRKFVQYPDQQDQEVPAEQGTKVLERLSRDQIYWEIKPAVKNTTYEVQWTW